MKTLEDTIKQYEQRVVKIRREADKRIKEIEKHIEKLKARFEGCGNQHMGKSILRPTE